MWVEVDLAHHMFMNNPARNLASRLNDMNATGVHILSDENGNVGAVAWVPDHKLPVDQLNQYETKQFDNVEEEQ